MQINLLKQLKKLFENPDENILGNGTFDGLVGS
jgi:hypothetical protein